MGKVRYGDGNRQRGPGKDRSGAKSVEQGRLPQRRPWASGVSAVPLTMPRAPSERAPPKPLPHEVARGMRNAREQRPYREN